MPFTGTELDAIQGIVVGFLAIGALITVGLVGYRLVRRALNRV